MKHIKTASDAETSMRKAYPDVTDPAPIAAEPSHEALVREIVELSRQKDLLELKISAAKGKLMGYVQGHAALVDGRGLVLATWTAGSERAKTDWIGVVTEMHIPDDVVSRHTTVARGSRVFTVCADYDSSDSGDSDPQRRGES